MVKRLINQQVEKLKSPVERGNNRGNKAAKRIKRDIVLNVICLDLSLSSLQKGNLLSMSNSVIN